MIVKHTSLATNPRRPACDLRGGREIGTQPSGETTVVNCYDLIDRVFPECGLLDFTDGTQDYHWTSEEWLRRVRRCFSQWKNSPRLISRLLPYIMKHPLHATMGLALIFTASWQWQFRGEHPPMKLLRQVWQCQRD